jgi:hypothetical protein
LLLDIIDNIVGDDQTSLVVVAFELLVLKSRDSRKKVSPWSEALVGDNGMEEFADQCKTLVKSLRGDREADRQMMTARRAMLMGRRRGSRDMSDDDEEEDEEEDDSGGDDDDDEEEDDE